MMKLDHFLDLETDTNIKIRDIKMRGGHFLVYKIPMPENDFIALPDVYKARAIRNVVAIKGLVLRHSAPFRPKRAKQYWEWDTSGDYPREVPKYKVVDLPETESPVKAGDVILYNSYNIAKVEVSGLLEPLVIIREVDILASWELEYDDRVQLGDHALQHLFQTSQTL